jgi:hypothetical protein
MTSRTLFDTLELPPAAARNDPATSHAAAAEITRDGSRQRQTLAAAAAVAAHPNMTSLEIARAAGWCRHALAKRLSDAAKILLVRQGPARRCGVSGRSAVVWVPGEGGAE